MLRSAGLLFRGTSLWPDDYDEKYTKIKFISG